MSLDSPPTLISYTGRQGGHREGREAKAEPAISAPNYNIIIAITAGFIRAHEAVGNRVRYGRCKPVLVGFDIGTAMEVAL